MFTKPLFVALLALALVTMACGININLPITTDVKTGPTIIEDISVPLPEEGETASVALVFGAGEMIVNPGAKDALVSVTARYNVEDFQPEVTVNNNRVRIEQGDLEIEGIPNFNQDVVNEWTLQLGSAPMDLRISAGAYTAEYEFGGVPLEELEISDGAADVEVYFSEPNPVSMESFLYNTGASDVSLESLANANFEEMIFRCGAGNYALDFSGEFQQDAEVTIESGISNIEIVIPESTHAVVTFEGGLTNVDADRQWEKSGNRYTLEGEGPQLTIIVKMGAGNLGLVTR